MGVSPGFGMTILLHIHDEACVLTCGSLSAAEVHQQTGPSVSQRQLVSSAMLCWLPADAANSKFSCLSRMQQNLWTACLILDNMQASVFLLETFVSNCTRGTFTACPHTHSQISKCSFFFSYSICRSFILKHKVLLLLA